MSLQNQSSSVVIAEEELGELQQQVQRLLDRANAMADNQASWVTRALLACRLSVDIEQIRDAGEDPIPQLKALFETALEFPEWMRAMHEPERFHRYLSRGDTTDLSPMGCSTTDVARQSGTFWSDLWVQYDDAAYFRETYELLSTRFELNQVPLSWIRGKRCLDDGCGAGRYAAALARIGAARVDGVDIGLKAIQDAQHRAHAAGFTHVHYHHASVLTLPFVDNTFDFVFSNGVLHHTADPVEGLREAHRVLKPGGHLWLYVLGTGGFADRWDDAMRGLLKLVPRETTEYCMRLLGFSTQRRFFFLDVWYAPIRVRYSSEALERLLASLGFTELRRLVRDVSRPYYTEINEQVYQKFPYATFWFGDGEQRYVAKK